MNLQLAEARASLRAAIRDPDPEAALGEWLAARARDSASPAETYALLEAEEQAFEAGREPQDSRPRMALEACAIAYFEAQGFDDREVDTALARLEGPQVPDPPRGAVPDLLGRPVDLTRPEVELELESDVEPSPLPPLWALVLAAACLAVSQLGGSSPGGPETMVFGAVFFFAYGVSSLCQGGAGDTVGIDFRRRTLTSGARAGSPVGFDEVVALSVEARRGPAACRYWVVAVLADGSQLALSDPAGSLGPVDALGAALAGRMARPFIPGEAWSCLSLAGGTGAGPVEVRHVTLPRDRPPTGLEPAWQR